MPCRAYIRCPASHPRWTRLYNKNIFGEKGFRAVCPCGYLYMFETILGILLIVMSLFLIVAVLMQHGKSHGLSGTIAGGAETFFGKNKGASVDSMLSKITTLVAIVFTIVVIITYVVQGNVTSSHNHTSTSDTTAATTTAAAVETTVAADTTAAE